MPLRLRRAELVASACLLVGAAGAHVKERCAHRAFYAESVCAPLAANVFERDPAVLEYMETCKRYGIRPAADLLSQLQHGVPRLAVEQVDGERFGNSDWRAFARLLLNESGGRLRCAQTLQLSGARLSPASMLLLGEVLEHRDCCLSTIDLSGQEVGAEGMRALAGAILATGTVTTLRMHSASLGDEGGDILADLLQHESVGEVLKEVDLQNNNMGAPTCTRLAKLAEPLGIVLNLSGNRVIDEVLNAVTHGLGEVAAIVGTVFLGLRIRFKPSYQRAPSIMYCIALNTLYVASTLYHSFFALGHVTVFVFSILDFCGIFLLIAGSYAPFLGILFHGEIWARVLMGGMWTVAAAGILLAAVYHGPCAGIIRLTLFLTMGWAAAICLPRIAAKLGRRGTRLLLLGGVLYTAGVPWFVRNGHTAGIPDHAIWHLWVVAGSATHYICIYQCVVDNNGEADGLGVQLAQARGKVTSGMSSPCDDRQRMTSPAAVDADDGEP